jgi:uncharacterized protein (DUF433 family)
MKKILVNSKILNGNPYIDGMRCTVFDIITECGFDGIDAVLLSNPELTKSDIVEILQYCNKRQCDVDNAHCGGCVLRTKQDNIYTIDDFINRFSEIRFTNSDEIIHGSGLGVMIMPGKSSDLESLWQGQKGWEIAERVLSFI